MIKGSFSVLIEREKLVIHGVTSIVANMNGFLFFTENHENYQMDSVPSENGLSLEYNDGMFDIPEDYTVLDYRK